MTKNWPACLKDYLLPPETVTEAVDRLMIVLDEEQKLAISLMKEDDLFDLHFTLGLAIRNAFGLHEPGSKLLASCGTSHPDDASGVIISSLWQVLQA